MPIQAAFVPHGSGDQELELILINSTGVSISFRWRLRLGDKEYASGTGAVAGDDFAILTRLPLDALNDRPVISWEIWPEDKRYLPFSRDHRIKASSFFSSKRLLDALGTEAHVLEVAAKLVQKPEEKPPDLSWLDEEAWPSASEFKRVDYGRDITTVDNEIDLHIEALRKDHESLSVPDKLKVQLKSCDEYLQRALIAGHNHVYIIHGVGSGKLRQAVHNMLKDYPHVKSFANVFHPRYGFGATEVRFKS